ncbi:PINc domain-containing protein [Mycena kentingensis (nom. inval.)]|nr:PINc domain-containing protein [Mycena kentingensis (nom. inval.)]
MAHYLPDYDPFEAIAMYGEDGDTSIGDTTLERIDSNAQHDVEMESEVKGDAGATYVVVDTNVLLGKLTMLQRFVEDLKRASAKLEATVLLIIPGAVLNELDKQKSDKDRGWFARRASEWMAQRVKENPRLLRCQRNNETQKESGNWRTRFRGEILSDRNNDNLILDCAMYFNRLPGRTCLCSLDRNLCTEAESEQIRTISPSSGHDLARFLFGHDMGAFQGHHADYTGMDCIEQDTQDDGMDVDDDSRISLQEAADLLHIQVIDHFTRLLVLLVARIGGSDLDDPGTADGGTSASRYAPKWKQCNKPRHEWDAADCLEYLDNRQKLARTNPRLDLFLSKPYSTPGSRTGKEWSYEAWQTALQTLGGIGETWKEEGITEDVEQVVLHRNLVFGRRVAAAE